MNKTENKIHVIKERSKVVFEIPKIITPPYQYDYTTRQVVAQSLFLGLYISSSVSADSFSLLCSIIHLITFDIIVTSTPKIIINRNDLSLNTDNMPQFFINSMTLNFLNKYTTN